MSDSAETSMVNSEHEESFETQEDSNVKSENEKCDLPTPKSELELSKPKRRGRRGKKRKQRKDSSAACENEAHVEQEAIDLGEWKSDEELDSKLLGSPDTVMVRPINVPKAPENYNTFIMDEHDECHLYWSFETPNPYLMNDEEELRNETCSITTNPFQDAAYMDIDYEYQSQHDFDSAYYEHDFEESYKNSRFDMLVRLSRDKLIAGIHTLELRLRDLSEDLVRENPSPVLEKLQAELLELQEKHVDLKECNSKLHALLNSDAGSAPGESPANSQTLTDGFSPQSDLVSPSHMIESKCELGLSEQSPRKGWSPCSPMYDRRNHGDIENDLFSKMADILKVESADVNANTESVSSAKHGECCLLQMSDIKEENSSSDEDESPNEKPHSETGYEANLITFDNDLLHSPKEMPNSVSSLENSVSV